MIEEIVVMIEEAPADIVVTVENAPADVRVTVSEVGLVGPTGPVGPLAVFVHHQTAAAAQWTLNHDLGVAREPTVLLDDEPTRPVWTDVDHVDVNTMILTFPSPVTGWAYL